MNLIRGTALVALATLVAVAWGFTGVERLVGDHEVGVSWEPFIKHTPTWHIRFENPAQKGLDLVPLESLSVSERQRLAEFCEVRFGQTSPKRCYEQLTARVQ